MEINLPVLLVNFKAYQQGVGANAVRLAKICEKVAKETGKSIAVAVQDADLYHVAHEVSIPVFAQHLEPITPGSHTGHDLPEGIKETGAAGCLLNHSEDRMRIDLIEEAVKVAKKLGLACCVCANDAAIAEAVATFEPDLVAVEPPELIGGDVSVSSAQPEVITDSLAKVNKVADVPVLCGAGVNSKADVRKAIELGSKGVLVASAIVKAEDPERVIREMVSAL